MPSRRFVAAIVVTLLACLALAGPSAQALTSTSGTVQLTATSAPDVLRGTPAAQPAGDLRFGASDGSQLRVVDQERIVIEVSDSLGENGENCDASGKFIGFHAAPTVTMTSASNVTLSTAIESSTPTNQLRSPASATGCGAPFATPTKDQLILTVSSPAPGGGSIGFINITGISYDISANAAVGAVKANWGTDAPPADASAPPGGIVAGAANGYITNLDVSSNRSGNVPIGTGKPFGTLTFAEMNNDSTTPAEADNGVCVNLRAPFRMVFVNAGTVAVNGSDTAGAPALLSMGHTVRFGVTAVGATKSTFVLSGVTVNVSHLGAQATDVTQCDPTGAPLGTTPTAENNESVTVYTNAIHPPAAKEDAASVRFAGANRNDTAARIAISTFACNPNADPVWAIVARNDEFADALAANYVAGQTGAPVLLVNSTGPLPSETVAALHDLAVTDVIVMGGTAAVGTDVSDALAALNSFDCFGAERTTLLILPQTLRVTRIEGADRFATARAAAGQTLGAPPHTIGTLDADSSDGQAAALATAILVNGRNFPDAVVAGPMAYQGSTCQRTMVGTNCEGFPLVLSDGQATTLPPDTDAFLTDHSIKQVIVVGGTAAVPQEIADAVAAKGIAVIRLAGGTRQATATAVATFEYQSLQFGVVTRLVEVGPPPAGHPVSISTVALARGDFFPDALASGPMAGSVFEPILLTVDPSTVGSTTDAYLTTIGGAFTGNGPGFAVTIIHLAGGTGAISSAAEAEALAALG